MILLVAFLLLIPFNASAKTLDDFYQSAVKHTPTIKDRVLSVEIAKAEKNQAIGNVLPEISANSNNIWRDEANVGAFGEGYQHSAFLNLKQPIFQGGGEYSALAIAKNQPKIAALQKRQEEIALYVSVAQAFFNLMQISKDKTTISDQNQLLEKRVKTLRRRAKIGQNKLTDVLASQSQLARLTAESAQLERNFQSAKMILENLTGRQVVGGLTDSLELEALKVPTDWDKKIMQAPLIQLTELELENAKKTIHVANGNFLPTVDLDANYYLDRAGILRDSEWDVGVNVSWNLYSGGKDQAQRRIAALQVSRIELRYNELKRTMKNEYQSLKDQLTLQIDMVEKLENALKLEKKNYKQYLNEADRGLVSQLDVLRVLQDRIELQRAYDREFFNTKVAWIRLKSLAGVLQ